MQPAVQTKYRDVIFWDVDTQVDFMLPEGRLYAPGAERILPQLQKLTEHARREKILVIASVDAHQPDDVEFTEYPPHCIAGTASQQKVQQTLRDIRFVLPNRHSEIPQDFNRLEQIVVEKQKTDVFSNPNLERLLAELGRPQVVVYGVVTEVCVRQAAQGLLDRGYQVHLVTDAIWPFREEEGKKSLEHLQRRGARLVTTEEILSKKQPAVA